MEQEIPENLKPFLTPLIDRINTLEQKHAQLEEQVAKLSGQPSANKAAIKPVPSSTNRKDFENLVKPAVNAPATTAKKNEKPDPKMTKPLKT